MSTTVHTPARTRRAGRRPAGHRASRLALRAVAVVALACWPACAAGALLLFTQASGPSAIAGGTILAGLFLLGWPRLGRAARAGVVSYWDAPELHRLVDEVAAALGTRTADAIVIDGSYGASWRVAGPLRRRELRLGLPLLADLSREERLALLARELGREGDGDLRRDPLVGPSIATLFALAQVLSPAPGAPAGLLPGLTARSMRLLALPFVALLELQLLLLEHCDAHLRAIPEDDVLAPSVAAGEERWARVEAELAAWAPAMGRVLLETARPARRVLPSA